MKQRNEDGTINNKEKAIGIKIYFFYQAVKCRLSKRKQKIYSGSVESWRILALDDG